MENKSDRSGPNVKYTRDLLRSIGANFNIVVQALHFHISTDCSLLAGVWRPGVAKLSAARVS